MEKAAAMTGKGLRLSDCCMLTSDWDIYVHPSTQGSGNPVEEERLEDGMGCQVGGAVQCSVRGRTAVLMNSQPAAAATGTPRSHSESQRTVQPDSVPHMTSSRTASWHEPVSTPAQSRRDGAALDCSFSLGLLWLFGDLSCFCVNFRVILPSFVFYRMSSRLYRKTLSKTKTKQKIQPQFQQ